MCDREPQPAGGVAATLLLAHALWARSSAPQADTTATGPEDSRVWKVTAPENGILGSSLTAPASTSPNSLRYTPSRGTSG